MYGQVGGGKSFSAKITSRRIFSVGNHSESPDFTES